MIPAIQIDQGDATLFRTKRLMDFAFLDPPFNIGQDYEGYDDDDDAAVFESMIFDAMMNTRCQMRDGGVIALHGPDELAWIYLREARLCGLTRIDWVIWHYRFGQAGAVEKQRRFTDSHCHCLLFKVGNAEHTFNAADVAVESDRKAVYNDKRTRDGKGGSRVPFDVWGVPSDGPYWGRVTGGSRERMPGRPNQLPEVYLERLIKAYTNVGDWVYDPFGGTGTTAVVSQALGRNCVTIDKTEHAVETIRDRARRGAVRIKQTGE